MSDAWNEFGFSVGMPHLAPIHKLSEVELLKTLAAYQWEGIARVLGTPPQDIASDEGERIYASVIAVDLDLGSHSMESLGEGTRVTVRNRIGVYAHRFCEGLFLFDDAPIPDAELSGIEKPEDLRAQSRPWATFANAFIVPSGGNSRLKVIVPKGMDAVRDGVMPSAPQGIDVQRAAMSGALPPLPEAAHTIPLDPASDGAAIRYGLVPESDLNGAGLVYFARYSAITTYAERRWLSERLRPPLSADFVTCLSTEHRSSVYFGNANPWDSIDVELSAHVLPPERFEARPGAYRTPLKILFDFDLYRASDKVRIATMRVRRALNVPADQKGVLAEAHRLLDRIG